MDDFQSMRDPDPMEIWLPYVCVYVLMLAVYFVSQVKKDNSISDFFWGTLFFLPLWVCLGVSGNTNPRPLIVSCLVTVWGLRIALNICQRHDGEDFRFAELREKWILKGNCFVYFASLMLFFAQTTFAQINNASAFYAVLLSEGGFTVLDAIGIAVWTFGFTWEVVADAQLRKFKRLPDSKGKLLQSGLWRYSRHPNFFGECVLWWGIYLISSSVQYGYYTFPSALLINLAIRFLSGVPLIEKRMELNPGFKEYAATTNAMVPWCPKRPKSSCGCEAEEQGMIQEA